jgi:hypothetical protein
VLARIGVRAVCVRRLTQADAPGPQFVTLSPRLALLEASLERAAAVALERRVRLSLRDLPLCVAPRLRPLMAAPESERWLTADGQAAPRGATAPGCPTCPGTPYCAGRAARLRAALRLGRVRPPQPTWRRASPRASPSSATAR